MHFKHLPDSCVSEDRSCGSLTVHNQITSSSSFICTKLRGSYLLHEPLRLLLYRLHPLRQTTSYPQQPHTRYPHCFWNKHKLTTPTNGSSCDQNSFICYSTLQKLSNARTPLNKPVRCYHTLWSRFFLQPSYSVRLCCTFYMLIWQSKAMWVVILWEFTLQTSWNEWKLRDYTTHITSLSPPGAAYCFADS